MEKYCGSIRIVEDEFLNQFRHGKRIRLMRAFVMSVREGRFSGPSYDTLTKDTVRGAISFVSQTFRENDSPNPTKDKDGELGRFLSRKYRAFKNSDPNPAQQKAIPICVIAKVFKKKATETQRATGQLRIRGFFIAGISCEYMKVPQAEKRRTYILRLICIRFFLGGRELQHSNPNLKYADYVSITFEWQKKDERNDIVTQLASEHIIMCPVRQWTGLVKRIRNYPGATGNTPVSAVWRYNQIEHITSAVNGGCPERHGCRHWRRCVGVQSRTNRKLLLQVRSSNGHVLGRMSSIKNHVDMKVV